MNNLQNLIKSLAGDGYQNISLHELAFQYKRQFNADIDVQQLRKALVRSGIWGSYMKDDVLTLSALPMRRQTQTVPLASDEAKIPILAHFNKLPQTKVGEALRK